MYVYETHYAQGFVKENWTECGMKCDDKRFTNENIFFFFTPDLIGTCFDSMVVFIDWLGEATVTSLPPPPPSKRHRHLLKGFVPLCWVIQGLWDQLLAASRNMHPIVLLQNAVFTHVQFYNPVHVKGPKEESKACPRHKREGTATYNQAIAEVRSVSRHGDGDEVIFLCV